MSKIIDEDLTPTMSYFLDICKIPHCSYETDGLFEYLKEFAIDGGYSVESDSAKNILIKKGKPKLCLQAHYDMVCMGKAPNIATYIEDGWLKARDSSLGADNGIAIAMMMSLISEGKELEFLLTSDEEVGLIGASALGFELSSKYMLNLDSEDEAEVYIGCAGGADITGFIKDTYTKGVGKCYEVSVKNLVGGHSGVDIDKGIPSAIKVLAKYLEDKNITQLASIYAGERANSIPANAVAIIRSQTELADRDMVIVRELKETPDVLTHGDWVLEFIARFEHGVLSNNSKLGIPDTSINLAIIGSDERGGITIQTSARAMNMESLKYVVEDTISMFEKFGFATKVHDKYPAWKPEESALSTIAMKHMQAVFGHTRLMAIHAGLECGVISKEYPNISFASIGPTIRYPHSTREMVDIVSVAKTEDVLRAIINEIYDV